MAHSKNWHFLAVSGMKKLLNVVIYITEEKCLNSFFSRYFVDFIFSKIFSITNIFPFIWFCEHYALIRFSLKKMKKYSPEKYPESENWTF
jgi:hypothetical protein